MTITNFYEWIGKLLLYFLLHSVYYSSYDLLNVKVDATDAEIKKAYRKFYNYN